MIVDATDTTVTLSWMSPDPPNGIITRYRVRYRISGSSNNTSQDTTNNISMYTVTGLASITEYVFEVRAFTRVGSGPYSDDTLTVRTSKLSVSMIVLIVDSNHTCTQKYW